MRRLTAAAALVALGAAGTAGAQTWTEPKSGAAFAVKKDDLTLLGGGLRVKKIVFSFKAYAIGLYVSDAAIAGPLAAFKGKTTSPEFYKELQTGDFKKEVADRAFAERLFGLYVGPTPLQADIRAGVVARAGEVIR